MDFNTTSPTEKLSKYFEFNNPSNSGGFVEYLPNTVSNEIFTLPDASEMNIKPLESTNINTPVKPEPIESTDLRFSQGVEEKIENYYGNFNYKEKLNDNIVPSKKLDFKEFEKRIRIKESSNIHTAENPKSSAVGYHQFLWGTWGDPIKKVTGVKSKAEFRDNPEAQHKFFKYYYNNNLIPAIDRVKKSLGKVQLSDFDLGQLIHFRGEAGAKTALKEGLNKKTESYNPTPLQYIKS